MELTTDLKLRLMGDWGAFNLTRICGWLTWGVFLRTGAINHTIHTGRGMADNVLALESGDIDVCVATPAGFARMAIAGNGPFEGRPFPGLRSLGVIPHRDAMLIAIPTELGITSVEQLRREQPRLRVALAADDGGSFMGFGARAVLRASGIELDDLVAWGGECVYGEDPGECVAHVMAGRADSIVQEAIMTPWWSRMMAERDLTLLSLEPQAAERLRDEYDLDTVTVPAGYFESMADPVEALDFSGWQLLVRDDMPAEVAALLAEVLADSPEVLEDQYRHLPVRNSPLDYPITVERLAAAPIPLHPAAAAVYEARLAGRTAAG